MNRLGLLTRFSSFILFIISFTTLAQDVLWEKSYGGAQGDYLSDVKPTPDFGFILAGSSASGKSGNKEMENFRDLDYWIWKMDEKGDLDWQRNFGGNGNDRLESVQLTNDGGFILAGTSDSMKGGAKKQDSKGQEDYWVLKLNADGSEQWQQTIGGNGSDKIKRVIQTIDGSYLVAGSSMSNATGDKSTNSYGNLDYWVVKLGGGGEIEWERSYGGMYVDLLESVIATSDEGFLLGGWSNSPISGIKSEETKGNGDYWLLKLDKYGELEWQRTIGGDKDDHLYEILETKDGNFLVGGSSNSGSDGQKKKANGKGTDLWLFKLTQTGSIDWQQTYDFGKYDLLTSILENGDGSLLIAGHAKTESTGTRHFDKKGINDYIALKISSDGETKWTKKIGSSGEDILRRITRTRDGGYVLAGTSNGPLSRDKNTGFGGGDFWVVKLLDEDNDEDPNGVPGLEAFPNPTESYTNIIVNHEFEKGSLTLYDLNGRVLQKTMIEHRTIPIDLGNLPVGVYLVTVKTDVRTESIKLLKSN